MPICFIVSFIGPFGSIFFSSCFSKEGYHDKNGEGTLVNILALVLVALGVVIGYIVTNPSYARQPGDGEEHIQLVHE